MAYNRTLQHFTSPQELATLWATGRSYLLNQVVFQDNKLYRCLINHTSGTFQTDYANSNWVQISNGLVPWLPSIYYTADQFIEENDKIYRCAVSHTSNASFSVDLGAGKWVEVSAGSGSGVKNYVVNGNFESNSDTGWSLARSTLDATTKLPNQISSSWTSAAGTLAKSVISSGQLAGSYSLQLSSTASTTAGDMLVTDALALDLEAQASVQTFSFFYKVTSNGTGTPNLSGTSSNAIGVAIYDETNSQWIQPAGVFNIVQSSGVGKAAGTFQVPSNTTSVRLAVYFPNSTAASGGSPFTVVLDDFVLGPQVVQYGAPVTDWVSRTPGYSNAGTTSTSSLVTRRVGDTLHIQGRTVFATAGAAAILRLQIPSAIGTIDTAKVITANLAGTVGTYIAQISGTLYNGSVSLTTTANEVSFVPDGVSGAHLGSAFGLNSELTYTLAVPISGWSSSVQMSQDTDTRVVAAQVSGAAPDTTALNVIIFPNVRKDTHAGYSVSTGKYTAPVSGFYRISTSIFAVPSTNAVFYAYVNNIQQTAVLGGIASASTIGLGSNVYFLNSGDLIDIRCSQNITGVDSGSGFSIERLSGPATIAASETVAMAARKISGNHTLNGSDQTVAAWDLVITDSHGAFNATTGIYTVPVSGRYLITGQVNFNSGSGTQWAYIGGLGTGGGVNQTGARVALPFSIIYRYNAGETISVAAFQNASASFAYSTDARFCTQLNISRLGN